MIRSSFLILLVAGVACGGDGGPDDSTALSDLSSDERVDLCEEHVSVDAFVKLNCYSLAIGSADCEAEAEACIDGADEDPCAEAATDELPACASEVTVGEFADCYEAQVAQAEAVAAGIDCDSDPAAILAMLDELPAACDQAEMACPDLYDDGL